jgi:hypothetical protein
MLSGYRKGPWGLQALLPCDRELENVVLPKGVESKISKLLFSTNKDENSQLDPRIVM